MIKFYRIDNRSVNLCFDECGNEELSKMFTMLLKGNEVCLNVEFDMSIIRMKKSQSKHCLIYVEMDNEIDGAEFNIEEEKIVWRIDNDYVEMCIEQFGTCKKNGFFFPAEFIYIKVPKNKNLDCIYCEFIETT